MDALCSPAFLQEIPIESEGLERGQSQCGLHTFHMCLHGVESQELQVILSSANDHFKGNGPRANLFWMGKREIPGSWVRSDDVVNTVVAIIQFSKTMTHMNNFTRYLIHWLKHLEIPDGTQDKIVRQSRVFTVRECEAMMLQYKSPAELDEETQDMFERLRQHANPETQEESTELARLMGECNEWMEKNNLPDNFFDIPNEDLCEAVVQYAKSGCATAHAYRWTGDGQSA
jgi:hypothetical protein